jgi:exoribonuclease-2
MTKHHNHQVLDLFEIARQTMIEQGFQPDFPPAVKEQVQEDIARQTESLPHSRDLRPLLWSSIDNQSSRDLDQVEFVEVVDGDRVKVLIGIANVDAFAIKDSAIDNHAFQNTTSVYAAVTIFPMLPEELSTNITSLVAGQDRQAVVISFEVAADGTTTNVDVFPAWIHNRAKLSYDAVGRWLDGAGPAPDEIKNTPGLEKQIRLQVVVAERLRELRKRQGALELKTVEARLVTDDQDRIRDLVTDEPNTARDIIENFMIAANVAMAEFLSRHNVVSLRRIVRTPKIGHGFGRWCPDWAAIYLQNQMRTLLTNSWTDRGTWIPCTTRIFHWQLLN